MKRSVSITVFGRVQGVSFRYSALERARELDIKGFVKNTPEGNVFIEAEGEEEALAEFIQWCHKGPSLAQVEKVLVKKENAKDFKEFTIIVYE